MTYSYLQGNLSFIILRMIILRESLCLSLNHVFERDIQDIFFWFEINIMSANPLKFPVMFLGTKGSVPVFIINNIPISISESVILLGITIDNKLNFKCHTKPYTMHISYQHLITALLFG